MREALQGFTRPLMMPSAMTGGAPPVRPEPRTEQRIYRAEALARFGMARDAEIGFVERLVAFWSNHFCVSAAKAPILRASAGSFEREAIRPFVLGRFADMLLAAERHPAMLSGRHRAPDRRAAGRPRPDARRAADAGPAPVGASGAERLPRHGRRLGVAGGDESAPTDATRPWRP